MTCPYCCPKNVRITAIIIAELEFGNIERHIFAAYLVERTNDTAFDDGPKAFDGLSMNGTDDILLFGMVNDGMRIFAIKAAISNPLIRTKQANFMRYGFADKSRQCLGANIINDARDNVSLALYSADDWRFAGTDAASSAATAALIPMAIFGETADESFVNLDNATKLLNVLNKRCSDFMAHRPCGFIGTEPHIAHDLQSAHALFASQHKVNDAEPLAKRLVSVLKNRARYMRETIARFWRALIALPVPRAIRKFMRIGSATTRASDAVRPPPRNKISAARIFVWEHLFEFRDAHLVNWLRLLPGHVWHPSWLERIMA